MEEKRILCFTSYYLPGFKNGGPVRSLMNMCQWLGKEYAFHVVTRDRDRGDTQPYEDRAAATWHAVGEARVWYLSPPYWSPTMIRHIVTKTMPDLLYFHSFLDPALTIMPLILRRLGVIPRTIPVLLAPRGEFSPGALALKRHRKLAYLHVAREIGLYSNIMWHATGAEEEGFIRAWWGRQAKVGIAGNLPAKAVAAGAGCRIPKQAKMLRLVFLSRISPMKNLSAALRFIAKVKSHVTLDIYGPIEDKAYWDECQVLLTKIPSHIRIAYKGCVHPEDVVETLTGYDLFVFPTLGENFGHVIFEALLAGCPVLLSDQTPWRDLPAKQVGFDIPLDQPARFTQIIDRFAAMEDYEFQTWSQKAAAYGIGLSENPDALCATRSLLEQAMMP